jgi:tetratricopeptide (TPR) repeat protein
MVSAFAAVDDLTGDAARERAVRGMEETVTRSLAEPTRDGSARRVHSLISRTIALLEPGSRRIEALTAAAIDAHRPAAEGHRGRLADGRANARARATPRGRAGRCATCMLLTWVAHHDSRRGDHSLARTHLERAVEAYRRLLGDEHPATLTSMNNLAATMVAVGNHAAARALLEETSAACTRLFGNEHPNTLTSMNNLAATLAALGDHERARTLYEQTLAIRRRILGDGHASTMVSMNNLAATLEALRDRRGARLLKQEREARQKGLR